MSHVTVIATPKLDDKDKQVGIFFDRNHLGRFYCLKADIGLYLRVSSSNNPRYPWIFERLGQGTDFPRYQPLRGCESGRLAAKLPIITEEV
uniref:Uncharacterized protein n=1 Tax=Candidatus Kentrum sp. FM TaxID=2126340 RepID=A0A450SUS5_9GAMM|nr:MAG: hypothetical protein BECKFM1743C_GA0114222_102074 [Candidatus Kentron sp. FM]VFJ59338.1 MAG: hypothetical protein BECKFM1743A_GA0114220_102352 [Candidatus Kentron sp. FM]VFK06320.1 MAG: hypothetical protein BECKFM1743B_GA0114221_100144 [Candidatus Kentron sp. FM]